MRAVRVPLRLARTGWTRRRAGRRGRRSARGWHARIRGSVVVTQRRRRGRRAGRGSAHGPGEQAKYGQASREGEQPPAPV